MKPYMPAIVALVILAALVGGGLVTARMLESPQAAFNRQADEKVEQAQRILAQYQGGQPLLVATLQRLSEAKVEPSTQPSTEPAAADANAPAPAGRRDFLADKKSELETREQELTGRLSALGGDAYEAQQYSSSDELRNQINANAELLNKALQLVRDAMNTPGGEGQPQAVATQLEARLLYHQADLKHRQAVVRQAQADAQQTAFSTVLLSWHEANNRVKTLQAELNGLAGGTINSAAPAPSAAPAAQPTADEPKPTAPKAAAPAGAKNLVNKLSGLLGKKPAADEKAEPAAQPAPDTAPAADEKATDAPATQTPPAEAAPAAPVQIAPVPPIDERIQQLQAQGRDTDGQIADAQKDVDRLAAMVKNRQAELDKARSQTEAAEKRMMELEDAGVDASDPKALKRFEEEYGKVSRANRDAAHQAADLQHGTMKNAKPDAQEENDVLTAPLVSTKPDQKIQPEQGLTAMEADLAAAQALLDSRQQLRKLIDTQIKTLEARRDQLKADLTKAEAWRATLEKEATRLAQESTAAVEEARKLEAEAVDILAGQGQQAAQRAMRAADEQASRIQDFHRQNAAPSPQLGYMAGHAAAVAGDLEFKRAQILAQEFDCLSLQDQLTTEAAEMGLDLAKSITAKPAANAAAEGTTQPAGTQPAGASTEPANALAQQAETARKGALEAAEAALKHYEEASGKLGRLWTVQTQVAAVHYLMASLKTGADAQKERTAALREYQTATRDRGEQAKAYRSVIDSLSAKQ